jgi:thymidylate synthase (FAD)
MADETAPLPPPAQDLTVVLGPRVYVLGRQQVCAEELDRFLADHGVATWTTDTDVAGQKLVEVAGRTCYMSFSKPRPGGSQAYLGHILEVGHGSVLEHAVWNLLVTGVSRSLTHELIRHRAGWGYSQLSQRYVDESVGEYVEPDVIADDPELHALWLEAVGQAHAAYCRLADRLAAKLAEEVPCALCGGAGGHTRPGTGGVGSFWSRCDGCEGRRHVPRVAAATDRRKAARSAARSVLPNATETKVFVTANARALRHFVELRGSRHAEAEIRRLALAVLAVMRAEAPHLFGDYVLETLPDGSQEVTTPWRKV